MLNRLASILRNAVQICLGLNPVTFLYIPEYIKSCGQIGFILAMYPYTGYYQSKFNGHYDYFGYWMNRGKLNHFYFEATRGLYRWLNRRSQKRSYTPEGFAERLKQFPLSEPPPIN